MSATETISLNITGNALQTLQKIETQVGKVTSKFNAFRNVLSGIAVSGLIANTLKFADSIQDLSNATGIATANVLGFGRAVQQNGGDLEGANNALNKFVLSISEAAEGGLKSQQAFQELGISLQDISTLTEQQLFDKAIKGLSQIQDKAKAAAIANELFGKSLRGVELSKLFGDYNKATQASQKYSEAIKKGAETQQEVETAINNLKLSLLTVLTPLSDLAKGINNNVDTIQKFLSAAFEFIKVIGAFFLIVKVAQYIRIAYLAIAEFATTVKKAYDAWKLLSSGFGATLGGILKNFNKLKQLIAETGVVGQTVGTALKRVFNGLAKGAEVVAGTILAVTGLTAAWKKWQEVTEQQNLDEIVDYIDQLNEKSTEAWMAQQEQEKALRQVKDALEKQKQEIIGITDAYNKQNNQLINSIDLEREYMNLSNDQIEIEKARQEIYENGVNAILALQEKLVGAEDEVKQKIYEQMAAIANSIAADQDRAENAIKNVQAIKQAQEELKAQIEDTGRAFQQSEALQDLQDQLTLIGLYGEELEKQTKLMQVQKALREEMQRLTIELLNLDAQRVQLGEQAYQRERARIIQQMSDAKTLSEAKISAYEEEVAKKQKIDESYAEGAARALKDISDAYKPINMAQEAVRKGWGSIENAIDTFVDTGKFKFADFARSVIADLAKMIAKAMIFKAISAALGAFGLKLPGMATGGPVEAGKGYIVGEKGPELFVPPGSGKIVPNKDLQGNGKGTAATTGPITNNYNTYNISALDAKSVAQMFAENRKAIFGANKMAEREMSYAGAR